jgi:hypothetical protein
VEQRTSGAKSPDWPRVFCGTAEAVPFVERRFPIQLSTVRFPKTFSPYCSSEAAAPAIFDTQPDLARLSHDMSLTNQIKAPLYGQGRQALDCQRRGPAADRELTLARSRRRKYLATRWPGTLELFGRLAPTKSRGDGGQNRFQHMRVVGNSQLIGDG